MTNYNQKGFSLIEVMISIGILTTIVMFSMTFLEAQRKGSARLNDQAARKSLAIQLAEDITRNYSFTPPMVQTGHNAYYVSCYNNKAQPTTNSLGNRDVTLTFRSGEDAELNINDICLYNTGSRYQSVYWWQFPTDGSAAKVVLRIFEITSSGPSNRSSMYRISF